MTLPDLEPAAWDAMVAAHPHGHVLQTVRWARLKEQFGWQAAQIPLDFAGPAGGASILFHRLPWGQSFAYCPKGPLLDWGDGEQLRALLAALRATCRRHRAALLRIEPDVPETPEIAAVLASHGFQRAPRVQPLSTVVVDLEREPEEILAGMKPKWRYNIRLAERKGVTVREGASGDLEAIYELFKVTAKRDEFGVHSYDYYETATQLFAPEGDLVWLLAEHEGQLLAAIAVLRCGRGSWYMWGASADEGRNLMPNHACQWAAIEWAQRHGCSYYDLWGIPDEVGADPERYADPELWGEGGLWGVYRFKQGFGGRVVRFTGAWDLPLNGPGYAIYRFAQRVRAQAAAHGG